MSVEGVIACTPRNLSVTRFCQTHFALSLLARIHLRLAVDAQCHQFTAANSASVHIGVPGPHNDRVPLLQLETSLLLVRLFHFHDDESLYVSQNWILLLESALLSDCKGLGKRTSSDVWIGILGMCWG